MDTDKEQPGRISNTPEVDDCLLHQPGNIYDLARRLEIERNHFKRDLETIRQLDLLGAIRPRFTEEVTK